MDDSVLEEENVNEHSLMLNPVESEQERHKLTNLQDQQLLPYVQEFVKRIGDLLVQKETELFNWCERKRIAREKNLVHLFPEYSKTLPTDSDVRYYARKLGPDFKVVCSDNYNIGSRRLGLTRKSYEPKDFLEFILLQQTPQPALSVYGKNAGIVYPKNIYEMFLDIPNPIDRKAVIKTLNESEIEKEQWDLGVNTIHYGTTLHDILYIIFEQFIKKFMNENNWNYTIHMSSTSVGERWYKINTYYVCYVLRLQPIYESTNEEENEEED